MSAFLGKGSVETARSIGMLEDMYELYRLYTDTSQKIDSLRYALLLKRQEIDDKLSLTLLDIQAVQAEIDCEQERAFEMKM